MRTPFGTAEAVSTEIQGRFTPGRDVIVTPRFAVVARALWPHKTAAYLAAVAGRDERTAKRWLSGEFEPPNCIIAAIVVELTKRE